MDLLHTYTPDDPGRIVAISIITLWVAIYFAVVFCILTRDAFKRTMGIMPYYKFIDAISFNSLVQIAILGTSFVISTPVLHVLTGLVCLGVLLRSAYLAHLPTSEIRESFL